MRPYSRREDVPHGEKLSRGAQGTWPLPKTSAALAQGAAPPSLSQAPQCQQQSPHGMVQLKNTFRYSSPREDCQQLALNPIAHNGLMACFQT